MGEPEYQSDSCLFENTQEDLLDDGSTSSEGEDSDEEEKDEVVQEHLFGDKLHLFFKAKDPRKVCYFTIRSTISLLYLGLLFTNQKVLLCDLTR